jgi:hypothetical protein
VWNEFTALRIGIPKFAVSNPAEDDKNRSTPSFEWEVKPSASCQDFTTR